jgi:hypothetical protein
MLNRLWSSAPVPGLPAVRTRGPVIPWCDSCCILWPAAFFEMCPTHDSIKCREFFKTDWVTTSFSRTVVHIVNYGTWDSFAKTKVTSQWGLNHAYAHFQNWHCLDIMESTSHWHSVMAYLVNLCIHILHWIAYVLLCASEYSIQWLTLSYPLSEWLWRNNLFTQGNC